MSEALMTMQAIEALRSDLIEGYYEPGQILSMSAAAKRYGVGRPAMRIAFKTMEGLRLLERQGETYHVFRLTMNMLWQAYRMNQFIAKDSPRTYLAFNPAVTTLGMFPLEGDVVMRTERFFEINAELAGGHSYLASVRQNNALLRKIRRLKDGLIGDRRTELDQIMCSARKMDFPTYDQLVDDYHELRLKRLPDLFHLAQQALKRPA